MLPDSSFSEWWFPGWICLNHDSLSDSVIEKAMESLSRLDSTLASIYALVMGGSSSSSSSPSSSFNGMVWATLINPVWGWTRLGTFTDERAMLWPQLALVKWAAPLTRVGRKNRIDIEGRSPTTGTFGPTDMCSSFCIPWYHSFGESWFFQASKFEPSDPMI